MLESENPAFQNKWRGFEIIPAASEKDITPKIIVTETMNMMGGLFAGAITPELSRDYVQYYTFPFLRKAANGAGAMFDRELLFTNSDNPDINEATDFTNVIFAWMHHYASSNYLPGGFSKRGVLRTPSNRGEFIARVVEMGEALPDILDGRFRGSNLWGNISALRTLTFFEVGRIIPLKFPQTDKQVVERLLDDIDLSI